MHWSYSLWFYLVICGCVQGAIVGQGSAMGNVPPGTSPLSLIYPFSVYINKDIYLFWQLLANDTIEMAVQLNGQTGWLAVGIGAYDSGHIRTDMIVGIEQKGVQDRFSTKKEEPHVDKEYNILSGTMNVTKTESIMIFTRKLDTPDKFEDREIFTDKTTKVVYAWGSMDGSTMQQHSGGDYGTLWVNFKTGQAYKYTGAMILAIKFVFVIVFLVICFLFARFIVPIPRLYKLRKQFYIIKYWKYSVFDFLSILLLIGMNVGLFFCYNDPRIEVGINLAALVEFSIALVFLSILKSPHFNWVFGVTYQSQLKYHRLYAWIAFAVISGHVITTLIQFGTKGILAKELTWSTNIFGLIAYGVLFAITILTAHLVRRKLWEWFKFSHFLFYLFLILGTLHATNFIYFCLPGLIIYIADRVYRFVIKYFVKARILRVETRGEGNLSVLRIETKRKYHPGQFFQVSFPEVSQLESHPYSISSSPAEENLTIHAKSLGKWSGRVVQTITPETKIRLEGPFGITADWRRQEVVVLFSGGIGATPYISIVRDHILNPKRPRPSHLYFYPTFSATNNLDWFTETWELIPTDPSVVVQRFVSQHERKSIELEEQGLRAEAFHVGRPPIRELLQGVCQANPNATKILVMACGPGSMWRSVQRECYKVSMATGKSLYFSNEVFKF